MIMDKLFSAFEKHHYYNISDLVRLSNQPIVSTLLCCVYVCVLVRGGWGDS